MCWPASASSPTARYPAKSPGRRIQLMVPPMTNASTAHGTQRGNRFCPSLTLAFRTSPPGALREDRERRHGKPRTGNRKFETGHCPLPSTGDAEEGEEDVTAK